MPTVTKIRTMKGSEIEDQECQHLRRCNNLEDRASSVPVIESVLDSLSSWIGLYSEALMRCSSRTHSSILANCKGGSSQSVGSMLHEALLNLS